MKARKNISKLGLQIVLGLFVGTFILTQSIYLEPDTYQDQQEQSSEDAPESTQVVISKAVTSSTVQFNLGFQSYLLEEIFQTEEGQKQTHLQDELISTANKALKVLLGRIIAPNAP
ncbi:MAG: hypothetical protein AB8B73_15735 [Ekhidna sp.]